MRPVPPPLPPPDPAALPAPEDLLLLTARILHENGEETHGTLASVERLGQQLGVAAVLRPA